MAQLRHDYPEFVKRQAEVIAIGPEDPAAFKDWWDKEQMPFPGLADHDHTIAKLYGQQVKLLKFGRMPALVVVDKQGLLRYQHYGNSAADIPANTDILALLDELNKEPQ